MSMSLEEHDYIGLSGANMEINTSEKTSSKDLNMKATELRLGLPGSESPERDNNGGGGALKNLVSGAKRGFSDTINVGSGKWVFSGNGGSEVDLVKNGGLFTSPRGEHKNSVLGSTTVKETAAAAVSAPPKPSSLLEQKPQVSAANGQASAPAPNFIRKEDANDHLFQEYDKDEVIFPIEDSDEDEGDGNENEGHIPFNNANMLFMNNLREEIANGLVNVRI